MMFHTGNFYMGKMNDAIRQELWGVTLNEGPDKTEYMVKLGNF